MAQLSNDCFAFENRLTPLDEALDLLARRIAVVADAEAVAVGDAVGRILAEDVTAGMDVPPHANSAVDGYAVFFDDLSPDVETILPVTGRAAAGHPLDRPARRGEAIRIFTGAPMPDGPDTVMMQEDCRALAEAGGERVAIRPGIRRGANSRRAGEDIRRDSVILRLGRRLRPQDIGLAASIGRTRLLVRRRLRVALLSTGDEVREPGVPLDAGMIYDANRYAIAALLRQIGAEVTDLGILPDVEPVIRRTLETAAAGHDLIVTSGGMSTGDEDHVKAAVETQGSLHFWRLAIKPGRPVALGQVGRTPFIGLPGNPVAVMVTFLVVARPLILGLMGAVDGMPKRYRVRARFDYRKKRDRREYVRARLERDADGMLSAHKFPRDGAGILSSMVEADGLVELDETVTEVTAGSLVDFLPFSEVNI